MVSSLPIMTLDNGLGEETLDGLRKECRFSRRVWVKHTSISKAINDESLHGTYKLSHRWVIFTTQSAKQQHQMCSQAHPDLDVTSQCI